MSTNLKNIFDTMVAQGASKDQILVEMVRQGAQVIDAVSEYTKFAKEAGMIKTFEQRMEWLNERLNEEVVADLKTRRSFTEGYAKEMDISVATAQADIRKWADKNNIQMVSTNRHSLEELTQFVGNLLQEDASREDILDALKDEMSYTESSALGAYSKALKELGVPAPGAGPQVPIGELVYLMRSHKNLSRKELVKKIMDTFGYKKTTASSFLAYMKLAEEYTRQELLAREAPQKAED